MGLCPNSKGIFSRVDTSSKDRGSIMTDPQKTRDALQALSEITAWAGVGVQSVSRGKTIPDLNELDGIVRAVIASPSPEPMPKIDSEKFLELRRVAVSHGCQSKWATGVVDAIVRALKPYMRGE